MLRIFNCFKSSKNATDMSVFLLKAELSFKAVAQVSYKNENGEIKIARFYGEKWSREILKYSNNLEDIHFKFFVHTPNIKLDESVKLSIEFNNKVLLSQKFKIEVGRDFAGWFSLLPEKQVSLISESLD